ISHYLLRPPAGGVLFLAGWLGAASSGRFSGYSLFLWYPNTLAGASASLYLRGFPLSSDEYPQSSIKHLTGNLQGFNSLRQARRATTLSI
ncbi:hypothetical protein, partial [Candidatus Soleaferrea massiliensis]|uniref:hypothetical protein n=1 Tax=Candidatus Soleaferrea massiliensis TaxID=1470354 RepID=UPI001A9A6712